MLNCLLELPANAARAARDRAMQDVRELTATVAQRAGQLRGMLSRLPHNIAEMVVDGLREPSLTRHLMNAEASHAMEAFGDGSAPLVRKACVSLGPGKNPLRSPRS